MCQAWRRALQYINLSFNPLGDRAHEHFRGTNEDTKTEMLNNLKKVTSRQWQWPLESSPKV